MEYGSKKASGDSLIFIDADVIYKNPDWVTNVEEALKTCDVVQPFTKAVWLDEFGHSRGTGFLTLLN